MKTTKIKLDKEETYSLWGYLGYVSTITECKSMEFQIYNYIIGDLHDQIMKQIEREQKTYTVKFRPFQGLTFLKITCDGVNPFMQNVIRKIRADLDQARI